MKIKALDYSSILNANSAALSSKNATTANVSARFNQENIAEMSSIYKLQSQAQNLSSWANVVNTVMDVAIKADQIKDIIKNNNMAKEQTDATTAYTEAIGAFSTDVEKLRQSGQLFDKDGNYTQAYKQLLTDYGTKFDNSGFSKGTVDVMKSNFATYAGNSYLDQVQKTITANNQYTSQSRQNSLNDLVNTAIATGQGTSAQNMESIYREIDSWTDLSDDAKNLLKYSANKSVKSGSISAQARLITDSNGFNDAKAYLDEQYAQGNITLDEYDSFKSSVYSRHKNNETQATQMLTDTWNQTLEQTGNIVDSRSAMDAIIQGAPEEMRETLRNNADVLQFGQFVKENPWYNEIATLLPEELEEKIEEVSADNAGYFTGMQTIKENVIGTLQNQIAINQEAIKTNNNKRLETQKKDAQSAIDNLSYLLDTGLGGYVYLQQVRATVDSYDMLSGTIDGANLVWKAINDLGDKNVKNYNTLYKGKVDSLKNTFNALEMEGLELENFKSEIQAKIVDFLYDYGNSEQGEKEINEFLDFLSGETFIAAMEDLKKNSDIKWGGGYFSDKYDLSNYFNLLDTIDSGNMFYIDREDYKFDGNTFVGGQSDMGKVMGIGNAAKQAWNNAIAEGSWLINQLYGEDYTNTVATTYAQFGESELVPAYYTSDGGIVAVVPVYGMDGKVKDASIIRATMSKGEDGREYVTGWTAERTVSSKGKSASQEGTYDIATGRGTSYAEAAEKAALNETLGVNDNTPKNTRSRWARYEALDPTEKEEYDRAKTEMVEILSSESETYDSFEEFQRDNSKVDDFVVVESYYKSAWDVIAEYVQGNGEIASTLDAINILKSAGISDDEIEEFVGSWTPSSSGAVAPISYAIAEAELPKQTTTKAPTVEEVPQSKKKTPKSGGGRAW